MSQTIAQRRAWAAYRAEQNKRIEARRKARIEALRQKLVRRFVTESGGWVFAAACIGAAFAVLLIHTI